MREHGYVRVQPPTLTMRAEVTESDCTNRASMMGVEMSLDALMIS